MATRKDFHENVRKILASRRTREVQPEHSDYTHAAVLIPLFKENGEYKVLFTKRTSIVEHHKGQISFPGGVVDNVDDTYLDTALREAFEEIGLLREDVEVLGQIDDRLTSVTNFLIHPYVGAIPYPYRFQLNSSEVERLVKIPLRIFISNKDKGETKPALPGIDNYDGVIYSYKEDIIWGATAGIMENLIGILGDCRTLSAMLP